MKEIAYIECGNFFIPTRSNHVCCCRRCRDKYTQSKKAKTCAFCGKVFYSDNNTKLCSQECKHQYRLSKNVEHICINCGKKFKGETYSKFCSSICKERYYVKTNWQAEFVCEWCGKKFNRNKYSPRKSKHIFCSHQCSMSFLYQNNIINPIISSQHKKINEILEDLKISYQNEFSIENYRLDIKLDKNKAIEIMGTYWHGDSRKYIFDKLEDRQKYCVNKDKRKQQKINENKIYILYLWQEDIENNIELCKQLILNFYCINIEENWHSSDYIYKDDKLFKKSDEDKVIQFMEETSNGERLNEKTSFEKREDAIV